MWKSPSPLISPRSAMLAPSTAREESAGDVAAATTAGRVRTVSSGAFESPRNRHTPPMPPPFFWGATPRSLRPPRLRSQGASASGRRGGRPSGRSEARHLRIAEARREVIVHQPRRLHEGVADGRPDEGEAASLEIAAQGLRDDGLRGHLSRPAPAILERATLHEAPQVDGETPMLALHLEKGL